MSEKYFIEAKPRKPSFKYKLFVYIGWNVGTFLWAAIEFIEGFPARSTRIALVYLGNVAIMNFAFWHIFRTRDRSVDALQGK